MLPLTLVFVNLCHLTFRLGVELSALCATLGPLRPQDLRMLSSRGPKARTFRKISCHLREQFNRCQLCYNRNESNLFLE